MKQYLNENLTCENYTNYIRGYILPFFHELRSTGKLMKTSKVISIRDSTYQYTGEIERISGSATGFGEAVNESGMKYRGTFINNLPEGVCVYFNKYGSRYEQEWKAGK